MPETQQIELVTVCLAAAAAYTVTLFGVLWRAAWGSWRWR